MKINVIGFLGKVKLLGVIRYIVGLILCPERKTCTALGRFFYVSHDSIYRFLMSHEKLLAIFPELLIDIAIYFNSRKKGWLIIDETGINKRFARFIEGLTEYYNSSEKRLDYGLSISVAAWSNGNVTIPIGFRVWIHKDIAQDNYKKRTLLAQELILECKKNGLPFEYLLADGLYSTREMLNFLIHNNVKFEMRAHSNKSVTIKGLKLQLKMHPYARLQKNQHAQVVKGSWYEQDFFFTTVKRKDKNDNYSTVYQVSNMNIDAKKHVEIYKQRWAIEKMFRTMKQKLGFAHCAARSLGKQKLHIYAVFTAYTFLETEKNKYNMPHPESVVSLLQDSKLELVVSRITSLVQNFGYVA